MTMTCDSTLKFIGFSHCRRWLIVIGLSFLLAALYLVLSGKCYFPMLILLSLGAILMIKPEWGLYLLVLAVPLFGQRIGFFNTELNIFGRMSNYTVPLFLVVLLESIFVAAILKASKKNGAFVNPLRIPLCFFVVYSLLSFLWSPPTSYSLAVFVILGTNILLFCFVFTANNSEDSHKKCVYWLLVCGIITAVLSMISIVFHPQYTYVNDLWGGYQFSILWNPSVGLRGYAFEHPNQTSLVINLCVCTTIGLFLTARKTRQRVLLILSLILMTFANVLTFSKGGLGSFVMMVCFIIFFSSALRRRLLFHLGLFMLGLVVVMFTAIQFSSQFGYPFHAQLVTGGGEVISLASRLDMWQRGLHVLAQQSRFLSGLGLGGFQYYTPYPHCHNLMLSFYFDFGVYGLLFLFCVLLVIRKLLANLGKAFLFQETYLQTMSLVFCGGLIAIGVHGTVDHYYNKSVLWLYLALAMSTMRMAGTESNRLSAVDGP